MTITEIREAVKNSGFDLIGIRHLTDDEDYKVGDTCRNSYDWDWENDCSTYETTGEQLDGACAYNTHIEIWCDEDGEIEEKLVSAINDSHYFGDRVVVIGGNVGEGGNDIGEIIIADAKVIAEVC